MRIPRLVGLAIGFRCHQEAMQLFERIILLTKPAGEEVDQFRVRWESTLKAKIVRMTSECLTEVMLPDAIDDGPME